MQYKHTISSLLVDIKKRLITFPLEKWKILQENYRTSKLTFFIQLINVFFVFYIGFYIVPDLHLEKISPLLKTFSSMTGALVSYFILSVVASSISIFKNTNIINFIFTSDLQVNLLILVILLFTIYYSNVYLFKTKKFIKELIPKI